ncbi:PTS system, N-acetylglucosamine-specific IIC component [Salinibacillus kushneri]|uniref:PTS system, N-acetylglucosamine-specific IIC component n=1 Tax=Salinibacillus kushneri TaxID=237682 RepID=A0A1H9YWJ6_9BACI|nr:PTS system, N-acetylglucosamine-specific IIC component [Salinibacillus kushneri]
MTLKDEGAGNVIAGFLISAGSAILDFIPILFAVGVAIGMTRAKDGPAAISGLVGYPVITTVLASDNVATLLQIELDEVNMAFDNIENVFIGMISGLSQLLCIIGLVM